MKKNKYNKSKFSGKGFYIAIAVCLLAVGVATVIAISRTVSDMNNNNVTLSSDSSFEPANETKSGVSKSSEILSRPSSSASKSSEVSSESSKASQSAAQTAKKVAKTFEMPLSGEIIKPYSNGELVKSETLGDWRTHDGIDIAAKQATPVKSCGDGVVTEIGENGMWGMCITIDHGEGVKSVYCGLNQTVQVKLDQDVSLGDVIGSVGTTNQMESSMPEHLHFGMKKDDKWVDPSEYIKQN